MDACARVDGQTATAATEAASGGQQQNDLEPDFIFLVFVPMVSCQVRQGDRELSSIPAVSTIPSTLERRSGNDTAGTGGE